METVRPLAAVVDDDESVRRSTRRLLRSMGVEAQSFASGDEFLRVFLAVPSFQPACVILDVQMPGISGLQAQSRLKASGLPVIFMTAHNDIGVRKQAMAGGAIAFLCKPFGHELFVKAVSAALQSGSYRKTQ